MNSRRVGVGVIGAGVISSHYLENLTRFPDLNVVAIADLDQERARARAREFGLRHLLVHELLAHDDIEIVLNLTVPAAHFDVSARILASGKHVWSEKPLAVSRRDARLLLDKAGRRGLRMACAPDTFLGGALQTAQRAVLAGRIGEPKSALAIMQSPGPEGTHPNPAFYYDQGAGPLLDMGPYHVTALVQTLGAVRRVSSVSSTARAVRRVLVGAGAGAEFDVRVPSQHMALLSSPPALGRPSSRASIRASAATSSNCTARKPHSRSPTPTASLEQAGSSLSMRNRKTYPLSGPRGAGAWGCWSSLARYATTYRNAPPAPSPATFSTCSSPSRRRHGPGHR